MLVSGWPLLLHLVVRALALKFRRPIRFLTLTGGFLGAVTYVLTFLPGSGALLALAVPLIMSLALFKKLLRMAWPQCMKLWAAQAIGLTMLIASAVWGIESLAARIPLNPLVELPAIYAYTRKEPNTVLQFTAPTKGNAFIRLRWESSNSLWLDRRANQAVIEAINPDRESDWGIDLSREVDHQTIPPTATLTTLWRSERFTPAVRTTYTLKFNAELLAGDLIRVTSLLPVSVPGLESRPPEAP